MPEMRELRAAPPLITVIGEALVDLIPVGTTNALTPIPGGSPLNVATGLARLGISTALMARLSDDQYGRLIRRHAEAEGIDLSNSPYAAEPTSVAAVSIRAGAPAHYDFHVAGTADWQWTTDEIAQIPGNTEVLHFGSIASWTPPGSEHIDAAVSAIHTAGRALVSYDPNVRPRLIGDRAAARTLIERSVSISHLTKASREDLEWLYPNLEPHAVAAAWLGLGAILVVVTDGPDGATAYRAPDRAGAIEPLRAGAIEPLRAGAIEPLRVLGRRVRVVDTVGAGDSFTAGLLSSLVRRAAASPTSLARLPGAQLAAALADAVLVSSITCERAGADPPAARETPETLGAHPLRPEDLEPVIHLDDEIR